MDESTEPNLAASPYDTEPKKRDHLEGGFSWFPGFPDYLEDLQSYDGPIQRELYVEPESSSVEVTNSTGGFFDGSFSESLKGVPFWMYMNLGKANLVILILIRYLSTFGCIRHLIEIVLPKLTKLMLCICILFVHR